MAKDGILNQIQTEIFTKILSSQHLCKYLKYDDNLVDIDSHPDVTAKDRYGLRNVKVFDYKRIPVSESEYATNYIACEIGDVNYNYNKNPYFKPIRIVFYVVCKQDTVTHTINGNRVNAIETTLQDILHNADIKLCGRLKIIGSKPENIANGYVGRMIVFDTFDKNEKFNKYG